jgi:hypothetical protein
MCEVVTDKFLAENLEDDKCNAHALNTAKFCPQRYHSSSENNCIEFVQVAFEFYLYMMHIIYFE